jgi:DNA helicase-2/ATP-dependent DNA helicase PcrA
MANGRPEVYDTIAILYRVNARSVAFERAFGAYHIPYHIVGDTGFFRRRVSRDLLAYMKCANNPADVESLARIVNVPKRGFGETKKEQLFMEGRPYLEKIASTMTPIENLLTLLDRLKGKRPYDAIKDILDSTEYEKTLTRDSDVPMLETFMSISSGFETVEDLVLYSSMLEEDNKRGVKLMTAHASKGLEFDRVFVVGVEKGVWPHEYSSNTEEEERLFFVASTRGKRYLNLSYSKSTIYRGKVTETYPSYLFTQTYNKIYKKDLKSCTSTSKWKET